MAVVTLSRGATSVDIELVEEAGEQLLATSFGKPGLNVHDNGGTINPRIQDRWSAMENYELRGKLYSYADAHALADLVKSASGTPLTLDIPGDIYDSVNVAPGAGQDSALTLSFPSGRRDLVDVSLSLTRVGSVDAANEQQATTPTASGTGPVEITAAGTTVQFPRADLSLERAVGRPNDVVTRRPGFSDPRYIAKAKVANDVFTLAFETVENIPATLNAITENVFREQLGRGGLVLDFNGLLGLGAFDAIPTGSSPFRQVHQAGKGWTTVPTFEFRRIYTDS